MKKTLSVIMVLVLMLTAFVGCTPNSKKIVGTWTYKKTVLSVVTEHKYVFNEDGTGTVPGTTGLVDLPMTYKIEKDQLTINTEVYGDQEYTISFKDNTLTMTNADNISVTLTKAEA